MRITCMWGMAASVTQAVFFLWATGLVKHLRLSLPTLSKSHKVDLISWPHSLSLSVSLSNVAPLQFPPLSLPGWMAVFSLSAWDLLGLKLTSLTDLLWRRISAQCDSAANVLVRVQPSFQIKKQKKKQNINIVLMNCNSKMNVAVKLHNCGGCWCKQTNDRSDTSNRSWISWLHVCILHNPLSISAMGAAGSVSHC